MASTTGNGQNRQRYMVIRSIRQPLNKLPAKSRKGEKLLDQSSFWFPDLLLQPMWESLLFQHGLHWLLKYLIQKVVLNFQLWASNIWNSTDGDLFNLLRNMKQKADSISVFIWRSELKFSCQTIIFYRQSFLCLGGIFASLDHLYINHGNFFLHWFDEFYDITFFGSLNVKISLFLLLYTSIFFVEV